MSEQNRTTTALGLPAGIIHGPESEVYRAATSPHNTVAPQHPAVVARPRQDREVAALVHWAADRNLRVAVQASGHGAGAAIGDDQLLIDTSALDTVDIDPVAHTGHIGAGATWTRVNAAAARFGLAGLAGTSPTVAVSGYTFGGGVGWLLHPYGLASAALLAVDYVDGAGRMRRAAEDAVDPIDREALWTFRGGGGVGIATGLTVRLVAPTAMWAGYRLWGIDALDAVIAAYHRGLAAAGDALSTSLAVLHTPPAGPFPPELSGRPVVHLAYASPAGEAAAAPLLEALSTVPAPATEDPWGPADGARLAHIHLDPSGPMPALGLGRWLDPNTPDVSAALLNRAASPAGGIAMLELRNTARTTAGPEGAMTTSPGPWLLHAVGIGATAEPALAAIEMLAAPADTGQAMASFAEGRAAVANALPDPALARLRAIRAAVDPERRIVPSRVGTATGRRQ
ncbi:FAD-binding oxidoreductase [Streptomyces gardneri]|uniref:FAD-binding oxidoreductase n=1 Tax=Nocardia sputi TaxID=2943705 RepID=UPI0018957D5A|nr:FAD-binding protein [Nocardia sputi]MBF6168720.1 FAD-binding oxidoreductase [Streptomyces gardneri]